MLTAIDKVNIRNTEKASFNCKKILVQKFMD